MNETQQHAGTPVKAANQGELPHEHHISRGKITLILLALVALVAAVWFAGYLPRKQQAEAARDVAHETQTGIPVVTAEKVARAPKDLTISLPGNISATAEASIFARAAGYVRKRYADIGDHVKAGQLMAEIETPELDQQVAQAQAALSQARQQLGQTRASLTQSEAQRDLAKLTWDRYSNLVKRGAVARQDADQQEAAAKTADAVVLAQQSSVSAAEDNVRQAQANLERVLALQDYKNVRAPFAGVVTVRNIDVGYLISPTGAGQGGAPASLPGSTAGAAAGNEMYRIAQTATLRILISVPQANAVAIVAGMPAEVRVAEYQGRVFAGKVTRSSQALDPSSRTMLAQVEIPNTDGKLYPGMYAEVRIRDHRDAPPLLIPGDALINGTAGTRVAVLTAADPQKQERRVHLQPVQVGRDFGAQTEIMAGLNGEEIVVVNPGDDVREGNLVRFEMRNTAGRGAAAPAGTNAARSGADKK